MTDGKTHVSTSVRWFNDTRYVTTCTFVNRYRARVRVKKTFDDPITAQPSITALINGTARARADADGTPVSPADTTLEHGQNTEWVKVPIGADGPQSPVTVGEADGDAGDPPVSAYTTTIDCGDGHHGDARRGHRPLDAGRHQAGPGRHLHAPQRAQAAAGGLHAAGHRNAAELHDAAGGLHAAGHRNAAELHDAAEVCTPPATGTPPNCTTPPISGVLPEPPTSGDDAARAARACAAPSAARRAKYANAYVTGSQIQRVTFYVNGRKVKTLTKPDDGQALPAALHGQAAEDRQLQGPRTGRVHAASTHVAEDVQPAVQPLRAARRAADIHRLSRRQQSFRGGGVHPPLKCCCHPADNCCKWCQSPLPLDPGACCLRG